MHQLNLIHRQSFSIVMLASPICQEAHHEIRKRDIASPMERGTNWLKNGTSRFWRDGWQP